MVSTTAPWGYKAAQFAANGLCGAMDIIGDAHGFLSSVGQPHSQGLRGPGESLVERYAVLQDLPRVRIPRYDRRLRADTGTPAFD